MLNGAPRVLIGEPLAPLLRVQLSPASAPWRADSEVVSIDAGFTCPNVDGTVAVGGCVFCDNRSFSPSRRLPGRRRMILDQIDEGIRRIKRRYDCDRFQAYFQPATNTYAGRSIARGVRGGDRGSTHRRPVIGTRPDCVPDDVLDLLQEFAERLPVSVEYGMQTMHDRSLEWMNRGQWPRCDGRCDGAESRARL
ncbi:MAG: hypothetical protein R3B96_22360 [Pirellulaceae bacterium]